METINAHSSFIKELRYTEATQTLRVQIGETWYYYKGVTKQKFARLKKATSKGKYYCEKIKGKYQTTKRRIK